METLQRQQRLIAALGDPRCYPHPVERVELVETHISWVLLTGHYAYKVKKGVDFGFLDYSTLEKRRLQCALELRLNRRTAPQLYLEVVPIGGSAEAPRLHCEPAIEYAVKMQQFAQQALLSQVAARGELDEAKVIALAEVIAAFHATAEVALPDSPYGTPKAVYHPVAENFSQLREQLDDTALRRRLDALEQVSRGLFEQHREHFARRKTGGFIRDCHGDLHLNNIVLLDGAPRLFDCIEFNDNLRIIDLISELAFLLMDLEARGHANLTNLLLNRYLELGGDYAALPLLPFYLGYRAMVRAKVAALRLGQPGLTPSLRTAVFGELDTYLDLAEHYARPGQPQLLITHGLSGSGKSSLTAPLLRLPGVVRIRSDVERKRLFGLTANAASHSAPGENIYSADASRHTYQRLRELAAAALAGGYRVIVDATFLERTERDAFRQLAGQLHIPFTLLHFKATPTILRQRVTARSNQGRDASEADNAVLERQLMHYQPLGEEEMAESLTLDSTKNDCTARIRAVLEGDNEG
ncbi:MAG: AAA family ATPase [Gammaproteobacteria bacterium]|nr:AAA family ATPase [Gammaproteobacteria bacterium]